MGKLVQDELFEADVRVEQMIWLPGAVCAEVAPDCLDELASSLPERKTAHLYKAFPQLIKFIEENPTSDDLAEELRNASGFLVQAATPKRGYITRDSYESGWGMYYTEWLYAATEADIAPQVLAWAAERSASDLAKFISSPEAA